MERECSQGDCMHAQKENTVQQWLEAGQVILPSRSLHIIDLAFVLAVLTPVAHDAIYKVQTTDKQSVRPVSTRGLACCRSSACCLDGAVICPDLLGSKVLKYATFPPVDDCVYRQKNAKNVLRVWSFPLIQT